jgi:hypothetical protein
MGLTKMSLNSKKNKSTKKSKANRIANFATLGVSGFVLGNKKQKNIQKRRKKAGIGM